MKPRPVKTNELVRKNAMIPQSSNIDWSEEQRKWSAHRAKTLEEAEPLHRLASGTRTYIDENTMVEPFPGESDKEPPTPFSELPPSKCSEPPLTPRAGREALPTAHYIRGDPGDFDLLSGDSGPPPFRTGEGTVPSHLARSRAGY